MRLEVLKWRLIAILVALYEIKESVGIWPLLNWLSKVIQAQFQKSLSCSFCSTPFLNDSFLKNHPLPFFDFPPTFTLLRYRFTTDLVFVNTLLSKKFFSFKSSIRYLAFFFLENFFGVLHKNGLHVDKHLRTKRNKHITGQWCQHFVPKG